MAARAAILQALCASLPLAPPLRASGQLAALAARCEGFSGADLQAVAYNAQLAAVHAALDQAQPVAAQEPPAGAAAVPAAAVGEAAAAAEEAAAAGAAAAACRFPWVDPATAWQDGSVVDASTEQREAAAVLVLEEHFEEAVRSTRPSTTPSERARRQAADEAFGGGAAGGAAPVGAAETGVSKPFVQRVTLA